MAGGRGQAANEAPSVVGHGSTEGLDRAHELEVLEQDVAVVAAHGEHGGPAHGERPGKVAAEGAVDEGPGRVPPGVPGKRPEVVLGPHEIGGFQAGDQPFQLCPGVANVVVGQHHRFVARVPHAGEHAVDLAV